MPIRPLALLLLLLPMIALASPPDLQKATRYTGTEEIDGWFISEKLDGIRGIWTGERLITRKGSTIHTPPWFTQDFPPFELDGELWRKRDDFNFIQRTVMDKTPSKGWREISYNIFEVPNAPGDFPTRLAKASAWFAAHPQSPARIIPQIPCTDRAHLQRTMDEVTAAGGEGLIVKDPSLAYHSGRTPHVLKVKNATDMEGVVRGINGGKGKYTGMMGSLRLELKNGVIFNLGTGFTDAQRESPPEPGSVVTFTHHGFTQTGKPRFAAFLRVRKD